MISAANYAYSYPRLSYNKLLRNQSAISWLLVDIATNICDNQDSCCIRSEANISKECLILFKMLV